MSSRHVSSLDSCTGGHSLKPVVLSRRLARVSTAFRASRHNRCVNTSAEAREQPNPQNECADLHSLSSFFIMLSRSHRLDLACRLHARHLLVTSISTLKRGLWPICWVYIAKSILLFVIERCTQRLTNACTFLLMARELHAAVCMHCCRGYGVLQCVWTVASSPPSALPTTSLLSADMQQIRLSLGRSECC